MIELRQAGGDWVDIWALKRQMAALERSSREVRISQGAHAATVPAAPKPNVGLPKARTLRGNKAVPLAHVDLLKNAQEAGGSKCAFQPCFCNQNMLKEDSDTMAFLRWTWTLTRSTVIDFQQVRTKHAALKWNSSPLLPSPPPPNPSPTPKLGVAT